MIEYYKIGMNKKQAARDTTLIQDYKLSVVDLLPKAMNDILKKKIKNTKGQWKSIKRLHSDCVIRQ